MALAIGTIAVLGALVLALTALPKGASPKRTGEPSADELTLFCAAGLRQPVEQLVAAYQREFGVPVRVQYGGAKKVLGGSEGGGGGGRQQGRGKKEGGVGQGKGVGRGGGARGGAGGGEAGRQGKAQKKRRG